MSCERCKYFKAEDNDAQEKKRCATCAARYEATIEPTMEDLSPETQRLLKNLFLSKERVSR